MTASPPRPPWLRIKLPASGCSPQVIATLKKHSLHTVCIEALCPNQMECFGKGIATFLLLGPACTRRCTFCAVDKSSVSSPDPDEPEKIARTIRQMKLLFCVLTMVTRDDLVDGGAAHIVQTVQAIRHMCSGVEIELLISDLAGSHEALETVLAAFPQVLSHNLETVPRLYSNVRPQANYGRSLHLLSKAAAHSPSIVAKSGLMLGLGETKTEVYAVMDDLRSAGCRLITLGQYLAPSENHHPVIRYIPPEQFEEYRQGALERGFSGVASAPLVRSSYRAAELYRSAMHPNYP